MIFNLSIVFFRNVIKSLHITCVDSSSKCIQGKEIKHSVKKCITANGLYRRERGAR